MFRRRKVAWVVGALVLIAAPAGLYGIAVYRQTHPEPDVARLIQLLQLKPGMVVAEIGAGEGRMTLAMARRLGPASRVFATAVDPRLLRDIDKAAAATGLQNVTTIKGADHSTSLPERCCDAIWMVTVYHHLTDPAGIDASIFRALRTGGRIAVIDFSPSRWRFWLRQPSGVPQNRGGHGIPEGILIQELSNEGFLLERAIDDWWVFPDTRYCVVFRKPEAD